MTAPFEIFPAIDLKAGQCVRLVHGEMARATVYNADPAAQAALFAEAGFQNLHIVDLDGAFAGRSENGAAVEAILKTKPKRVQLGGGIRTIAAVEAWLERGVHRVILGTAAVREPTLVLEACRRFPGSIAVGIDAKDGEVKTDGWAGGTGRTVLDVAKRFADAGVAALIFTDIGRDGALTGVNVEATASLAAAISIPVIASGGVASADDLRRLARHRAPIAGAIIGRALYDGRISAVEALAASRR